jgi:hypothetical protein
VALLWGETLENNTAQSPGVDGKDRFSSQHRVQRRGNVTRLLCLADQTGDDLRVTSAVRRVFGLSRPRPNPREPLHDCQQSGVATIRSGRVQQYLGKTVEGRLVPFGDMIQNSPRAVRETAAGIVEGLPTLEEAYNSLPTEEAIIDSVTSTAVAIQGYGTEFWGWLSR